MYLNKDSLTVKCCQVIYIQTSHLEFYFSSQDSWNEDDKIIYVQRVFLSPFSVFFLNFAFGYFYTCFFSYVDKRILQFICFDM